MMIIDPIIKQTNNPKYENCISTFFNFITLYQLNHVDFEIY